MQNVPFTCLKRWINCTLLIVAAICLDSWGYTVTRTGTTPFRTWSKHAFRTTSQPSIPSLDPTDEEDGFASQSKKPKIRRYDTNDTYNFWAEDINLQSFNMDLQNLATEDPRKAKDALDIMSDMFERGLTSTVEPDCRCYNTVIDGYVQAGYLQEAQDLLDDMERLADECDKNASAPSDYTYMMVTQAWADDVSNDVSGKSADQAERLMRRIQERGFEPNVKVWSIVLEGWCKRARTVRTALKRAESLLTEMEDAMAGDPDSAAAPPPNIVTYTSYIGGLARSKDRCLARKADATLARMERAGVQPDVVAYTSVINCWAKAINRREREMAASRALRILDEMERRFARGDYQSKPNLISYATAIRAVGNSLDRNAAQLAEGVLNRLYELHRSAPKRYGNLKPTTAIYNAVINALSRAPGNRVMYARKAEKYLDKMFEWGKDVQPDVHTYAAVLRSWSMSGAQNAAENAQRVLDKLATMYKEGKTSVRPNYVCYTTVMGAWGHSRRPNALANMEAILLHMEDHFTATQDADMRPNTVSYVTAIDACVRRNYWNAAQRAQETVDRMMRLYSLGLGHVRPTRIVFNTLIHAWGKSTQGGAEAAQRAEEIFTWMEGQYRTGDLLVRPDEVSLCAVLNAWANQAETVGAQRAQQIFDHMQSLTLEQRGFHISITAPNIVVKAIARSKDRMAVAKAEEMLIKLENDYMFGRSSLRPDVTTYSSVINCCAYYRYPEGKAEALKVALRTFRKLCDLEGDGPNNITFGTLFKAIAQLMPTGEERDELVRRLFDKCCEDGFVDSFVLSVSRTQQSISRCRS